MNKKRKAVVTGASSGIGRATAIALADAGFELTVGARRRQLIEEVASEIGGRALELDVTDPASVESFVAKCPESVDVLVNNAGGAIGLETVEHGSDEDWLQMWQSNVLGSVRVTRGLLPALRRAGHAHIAMIGSIAGFETYVGGAGYTAAKHGLRAVTKTLRLELLGEPIRITEIAPGLVETEFSLVRFRGDRERAEAVYKGMTPLVADDVARCVLFAVTQPEHVNIDEIVVRPRDQATATAVYRDGD